MGQSRTAGRFTRPPVPPRLRAQSRRQRASTELGHRRGPAVRGHWRIAGKVLGEQLFSVFVQGSGASFNRVTPLGSEGYAPAWSPDGRRLAYQAGGGPLPGITTIAPDGSASIRVVAPTAGSWTRAPSWSPDGRWIAYVAGTSGDDGDVYIVPSAGGGAARRLSSSGDVYDWRPAWLP
jgi:hypothetical protein